MMEAIEGQQNSQPAWGKKLWKTSLVLLSFSLAFFVFSNSIANIDLWIHLKAGLDNISNSGLARFDSYSYLTGGEPWINHEWLAQVLFGLAWLSAKTAGLVFTKVVLGIVTIAIIYWNFSLQRVDTLAGIAVIFVGIVLLASDFSTIYPQIFTLPALAGLFFILIRAEEGKFSSLWAAPILFLFWANLHGGFLVGLVFLVLWVLMRLLINWMDWKYLILPMVASIFAVLFTPYGFQLFSYLMLSSNDIRPEIWAWIPLTLFSPLGIIFLFMLSLSIVGFTYTRRYRSVSLIVLFCLAAVMPLLAKRHLSLFAVAAVMVAGEHIADLIIRPGWMRRQSLGAPVWTSLILLVMSIGLFLFAIPNLGSIVISSAPPYPVQAVQIIKESGVKGNLAVEYNWGGYVIWHLAPDVKVSVDGRRETVYSSTAYSNNMNFLLGLGKWDSLLNDYPTDMVLVNDHSPVFNLMKFQPGWRLVFQDQAGALYVRVGSAIESALMKAVQDYSPVVDQGTFP